MFWFDPSDSRAIFADKRRVKHTMADCTAPGGSRTLIVDPTVKADFTALPFTANSFAVVVFDPPHLIRVGKNGWLAKKYGQLGARWQEDIQKGFAECFRVLKPEGTLVFKWNERDIPTSQIVTLSPHPPLFGNRCGKRSQSHWIVFIKP